MRQQVHRGKLTGLKDDESRRVPNQAPLLPELRARRLQTRGAGLLSVQAGPCRRGGHSSLKRLPQFMRETTLREHLTRRSPS